MQNKTLTSLFLIIVTFAVYWQVGELPVRELR